VGERVGEHSKVGRKSSRQTVRSRSRIPRLLAGALLLALPAGARQQAVLYSSGFDDDDLGFWTIDGPPGSEVTVDDSEGQPPGALRLTVPSLSQNLFLRSPCLPLSESTVDRWRLSADVLHVTPPVLSFNCQMFFRSYASNDCSGGIYFDEVTNERVLDQWHRLTLEDPVVGDLPPPLGSLHVLLSIRPPEEGTATCFFDNVELLGPAEPIPALGPRGIAALATLLALAALLRLTMRR
jgi:hypothetical protein